eukprot:3932507-Rhodomonas_salina.1
MEVRGVLVCGVLRDARLSGCQVFKTASGRAKLVDDITELHTFLRTRLLELDSSDFVAVTHDDAPAALQNESKSSVEKHLATVAKCLVLEPSALARS